MKKQTKNIITREWVEKELRFYNSADLKVGIGIFAIAFFTCVPFSAFFIWLIVGSTDNLIFKIAGSVILGGMFIVPVIVAALAIPRAISERRKLIRGEFDIVAAEMSCKTEKAGRRQIYLFLHFPGFREKQVDKTTYFHAEIGDEFYIVHYRTEKSNKTIKLLYSAKMYEYVQ